MRIESPELALELLEYFRTIKIDDQVADVLEPKLRSKVIDAVPNSNQYIKLQT